MLRNRLRPWTRIAANELLPRTIWLPQRAPNAKAGAVDARSHGNGKLPATIGRQQTSARFLECGGLTPLLRSRRNLGVSGASRLAEQFGPPVSSGRDCRGAGLHHACSAIPRARAPSWIAKFLRSQPHEAGFGDRRDGADGLEDRRGNFAVHANQRYGVRARLPVSRGGAAA
jgi:hypothetical protein